MSMDDDDIDAEISMIEQAIEEESQEEAHLKLNKSKGLLLQRKTLLELKKEVQSRQIESPLLPQPEVLQEELVKLEEFFANEWGLQITPSSQSKQLAQAIKRGDHEAGEILAEAEKNIASLKEMKDSILKLLDEAEVNELDSNLEIVINNELLDLQKQIENARLKKLLKEIAKKEAQQQPLQRIIAFCEKIKSLINTKYFKSKEFYSQDNNEEEKKQSDIINPSSSLIQEDSHDQSEFQKLMNEMKYYQDLPEGCFEKILTQILCALFLKTEKIQQAQEFELKKYLDESLKNKIQLDSVITNGIIQLKNQLRKELIQDKSIIKLVNQLDGTIYQQNINSTFWQILAEMRKFHINLFLDYCKEGRKVANLVSKQDIVFLLGTTGCGKSTTIHYLGGSEMFETKINGLRHIGYKIKNQVLKDVKTSPFAQSETRYIKLISINQQNEYSQKITMQLVDSPGLLDTKSPEIDASNQIGIYEAFCKVNSVKPVIILSLMNFGDRGEDFKKIVHFYASMVKNFDRLTQFFFLFSHSKQKSIEQIKSLLDEFKQTEDKRQNKDKIVMDFIDIILEQIQKNRVSLINPMDKSQVFPILQNIEKSSAITEASQVFQKNILEATKTCINDQINIQSQEILNALQQPFEDETYACYKLEQLSLLAEELDQYSAQYNDLIIKISSIFNEKIENICNQIGEAFKKDKNLNKTDCQELKNIYQYMIKFERLRTTFLGSKVHSSNQIIDRIVQYAFNNRLKLGSQEGSFNLNDQVYHNYFDKLELLKGTGFQKFTQERDSAHQDFKKQLQDQKRLINAKILKFISIDVEEVEDDEKESNLFFQELIVFYKHLEKGIQLNSIDIIKGYIESTLNEINISINEKLENIQKSNLSILYSIQKKSDNDLSNLQQRSIEELESEINFQITPLLIKSIKKYSKILNKFTPSFQNSDKFDLYLQIDQRKKQLEKLLAYWFIIQEEIIRKQIKDVQKQSEIKKRYDQMQLLFKAQIVDAQISGRYLRLKSNLSTLVEKKQQEIKIMIPKLCEGIDIIQNGIQGEIQIQQINLYSLKEAVMTIQELKWTMDESEVEDYFSQNKNFLHKTLERLVEAILDQIEDQKLNFESIMHFKNVSKALKYIDQISKIAEILKVELENNSLSKFRDQIEDSVKKIEFFFKIKFTNEVQSIEGTQQPINKQKLLKNNECSKLNDCYQYLTAIKENKELMKQIIKSKEDSLNLRIETLQKQSEELLNEQITIISQDFDEQIKIIKTYYQDNVDQVEEDKKNDDNIIQKQLRTPINQMIQHFKIIKLLKSTYQELWNKIDQSNFSDEDFKQKIIQFNLELNSRIQDSTHNSANTPRLYNMLRVVYFLQPLGQWVCDRQDVFENYYQDSKKKITNFNKNAVSQAEFHIKNQEYGEILIMIEQLKKLNEPESNENLMIIKSKVKERCRIIIYQIERQARQMIMSQNIKLIYDEVDTATQIDLNSAIKELSLITEREQWKEFLGQDQFQKGRDAIQSLSEKLYDDNESIKDKIMYKLKCGEYFEADELITKHLNLMKYIQINQKDEAFKLELKKLQSDIKQEIALIPQQFKWTREDAGSKEFMREKRSADIIANLGNIRTNLPTEFAKTQSQIIEILKFSMSERILFLKDQIQSRQFRDDLRETSLKLSYMPLQIQEEYKNQLLDIESTYKDKVSQESAKLNIALKNNLELAKIQEIVEQNIYGLELSRNDLVQYFKQKCIKSQELLKENISKFLENNLIPIWDIISVEKLKDILRSDFKEFKKLRKIINQLFQNTIKIIFKSITNEGERVEEQSENYQQINEDLAVILFSKIIELTKKVFETPIFKDVKTVLEQLNGVVIAANSQLKQYSSGLIETLKNDKWADYFKILERLKINEKIFQMLQKTDVEDYYLSKEREDQRIQEQYKEFKNNFKSTNYQQWIRNIIPKLQNSFAYFLDKEFQLINQQTKNVNNERKIFYELTNQNYLLIKYCTNLEDNFPELNIKKSTNLVQEKLKQQVELIIRDAENIADNQNLRTKEFETFKQLDDYLANLMALQYFSDLADIVEMLMKKYEKIQNNLIEQCKKSHQNAMNEVTVQKAKTNIDHELIAQELILLSNLRTLNDQKIKDNCTNQIKKIVDEMGEIQKALEKHQSTKEKATFIFDIACILQGNPQGQNIVHEFSLFIGIKRRLEEEKYPKKDVTYVLSKLTFNNREKIEDVSEQEKVELMQCYQKFQKIYMEQLSQYLGPPSKVQENLVTIRNNLNKLVKLDSGNIDFEAIDKIPHIIALLFAIFTIQDSDVFHQNQKNGDLQQGQVYLLKPHAGQIIAILRILGIGNTEVKSMMFKYDNKKLDQMKKFIGKRKQFIFDNLAQIKTGEGKSYALGILSSIFALWGFNVSCASYSEYLSKRDYQSFSKFFSFLNIQDFITYSTFNQVCENFINSHGDIRKQVLEKIMKDPTKFIQNIEEGNRIKNARGEKNLNRPQILLIDEVDVFFGSDFFGKMFSPTTNIKSPEISQLLDYIWSQRSTQHFSLNKLKQQQQYKDCLSLFNDKYIQIFDASCKDMLFELQNYKDHGYKVFNHKIGYIYQDQISYSMNFGYKTIFAHYHEFEQNQILQESLESCKSLSLQCAQFSYSEIPLKFALTLGVTGTLDALTPFELSIIRNTFQLQNFSYIPSVYGSSQLDWENRPNRLQICKKEDFHNTIITEIQSNLTNYGNMLNTQKRRAVLIFFQNEKKLEEFRQSSNFKNKFNHTTLTEKIEDQSEKERIVFLATQPGSITLSTPNFGRGTDFICRNQEVEQNGGLHVILTFMCTQQSEFIQIQGRTARQGNKGSFQMVLLDDDLKKFNVSFLDQNFQNYQKDVTNDKWFGILTEMRDKCFNTNKTNELKNIDVIKQLHDKSIHFQNELLGSSQHKKVLEYLISINNDRKETGIPIKTLILMDATGSMTNLLQKAKNSVQTMFEQTSLILEKNNISPDLILIQFAVFRNYDCEPDQLLQRSGWESKPNSLKAFMEGIEANGGIYEEAVEVALQHSVYEAKNCDSIPLSQVFLIGDAPSNPNATVAQRRQEYGINWVGTKFEKEAFWDKESQELAKLKIPVHTFYVDDWAKKDFKQIARITGGTCQYLDINNEEIGQKMLVNKFSSQLLLQIGDKVGGKGLGQELANQFIQRFS